MLKYTHTYLVSKTYDYWNYYEISNCQVISMRYKVENVIYSITIHTKWHTILKLTILTDSSLYKNEILVHKIYFPHLILNIFTSMSDKCQEKASGIIFFTKFIAPFHFHASKLLFISWRLSAILLCFNYKIDFGSK